MVKKATDELRFEAPRWFEVYINDECSLAELTNVIRHVRHSNAGLFDYMISVVIKELEGVEEYDGDRCEKILNIISDLIVSRIMRDNQSRNSLGNS
jgi:hypothetical protein